MGIFRIGTAGGCLAALSLSACTTASQPTVGGEATKTVTKVVGTTSPPASKQVVARRLSAHTLRVLNRNGLTTAAANKTTRPRISENSVLARGTSRQRKLVTEIELVRMTDANRGPVDSAGVVHPSIRNRLVWMVITRDPYPFVSGPIISTPRPAQTAPSSTSYLWNALDAQTGKFLQAETFESTD